MRISVKAVIVQDGKLLTLQCRDAEGSVFYVLPGGGQEAGESLHDALRRECLEEIGVPVSPGELLYVRDYMDEVQGQPDKTVQQVEIMFAATLEEGCAPAAGHHPDDFQEEVAWLPLGRLEETVFYPLTLRGRLCGAGGNSVYLGVAE